MKHIEDSDHLQSAVSKTQHLSATTIGCDAAMEWRMYDSISDNESECELLQCKPFSQLFESYWVWVAVLFHIIVQPMQQCVVWAYF